MWTAYDDDPFVAALMTGLEREPWDEDDDELVLDPWGEPCEWDDG